MATESANVEPEVAYIAVAVFAGNVLPVKYIEIPFTLNEPVNTVGPIAVAKLALLAVADPVVANL